MIDWEKELAEASAIALAKMEEEDKHYNPLQRTSQTISPKVINNPIHDLSYDRDTVETFLKYFNIQTVGIFTGANDAINHGFWGNVYSNTVDAINAIEKIATQDVVIPIWVNINNPTDTKVSYGKFSDISFNRRQWIVLDIDPNDKADQNLWKEHALEPTLRFLADNNIKYSATSYSGRGCYVFLHVDLEETAETKKLVKEFLQAMNNALKLDSWHVDTKVGDVSRIVGVPGTRNHKTKRLRLLDMFEWDQTKAIASREQLQSIVNKFGVKKKEPKIHAQYVPQSVDYKSHESNSSEFASKLFWAMFFEEYGNKDHAGTNKAIQEAGFEILEDDGDGFYIRSPNSASYSTPVGERDVKVWDGLGWHSFHSTDTTGNMWSDAEDFARRYLRGFVSKYESRLQECNKKWEDKKQFPFFDDETVETTVKQHYIPLRDEWFCPVIRQIRNNFFQDYEKRNGLIKNEDKMLITFNYSAMIAMKTLLGKRYAVEKSKPYIGSDCIIMVNETTRGKTKIYQWIYENIYATFGHRDKYKTGANVTINSLLKFSSDTYSPPTIATKGKPTPKTRSQVENDCINCVESMFITGDEVAEPLAKMSGSWSDGKQSAKGVIMQMIDDTGKGLSIEIGSVMNGNSVVYDHAYTIWGGSTISEIKKSFNVFSQDNLDSGLQARFFCVFDNEKTYDYSSLDLRVTKSLEDILTDFIHKVNDKTRRHCYFHPDTHKLFDSINFGKHQYILDKFRQDNPTAWRAAKQKTYRQAQTDAMLWAVLTNKAAIKQNGWTDEEIDCTEFFEPCLKARIAAMINAVESIALTSNSSYTNKILDTVRSKPGIATEKLKIDVSRNKGDHYAVKEEIDLLVLTGKIIASEAPGTGRGRRPTVYHLPKENLWTNS